MTRNRFFFLTLFVSSCMLMAKPAAAQNTWYVDDDTCPGVGDGSNGNPFCLIQDAIDIANDTDEIIVELGTYNEAIDFLGKAIIVRSTDPTDPLVVLGTIIDGTTANAFHVVQCVTNEGPDSVLSGFVITGGDASGASSPDFIGGGMLIMDSSPTVTCCTFYANHADNGGGGMYVFGGSPKISNCEFSANTASSGAGLRCGGSGLITVENCEFRNNIADFNGGGIDTNADLDVTNCHFERNEATTGGGGGMWNIGVNPTITGCTFIANTALAGSGGAMVNFSALPVIAGCTMTANVAGLGGGMVNSAVGPPVINTTICGNIPDQLSGGPITDGGGNIISDICPPPKDLVATGGCCVNGNCVTLSFTDCLLVSGAYQGDNTDCAVVVCPAACPSDFTGGAGVPDGFTDVLDLIDLLAAWGACP